MSRRPRRIAMLILAIAGLAASAAAAWADPPARVGRLSTIEGTVLMHMADEDQWSPAALNYPVTTGSSFWTEPQSRAELRVGPISIHLDGGTEFDIVALDDHQLLANAPQGRINLWVANTRPDDFYSIATPRGSLEVTGPGTFRITAGNDQEPTEVAVLDGSARLVGPTSTIELRRGEAAIATGPGDNPAYSVEPARPTPFDDASLASEHRERSLPARRYISPEMTGYEDLDDNGSWRTEADIGPVWYPQAVPVDWQPYRYGHWTWVDPWGWTWIDDQPWGFAPFHYGRWTRVRDRWGWVPGRITPRPAYAPALVAFIGGDGWNVGLSLGRDRPVGWFPLAPREVYVPSYRASVAYVRKVNITNVVNVTNITSTTIRESHADANYRNRENAVVLRQSDFAGSRQVSRAALAVQPSALADAPVAHPAAIAPALAARPSRQPAQADQDQAPNARASGPPIRRAERTPPSQGQVREPAAGAPGPQIRGNTGATANVAPVPREAPAVRPQVQATPPAAAAPGPPIRRREGATATLAPAPHETSAPEQREARPPAVAAPGPPVHRGDRPTANVAPPERGAPAAEPQHQATTPGARPTPPNPRDERPNASAPTQHPPVPAAEAAIPREPRRGPPEHPAVRAAEPRPAIAVEAPRPAPPRAAAPPVVAPAAPHPAASPEHAPPAKAEPPKGEKESRKDEPHP